MRKDFCIIKNGFINLDELVYETIFIIVFGDYDSESEESSKGEVVRVPKIASQMCIRDRVSAYLPLRWRMVEVSVVSMQKDLSLIHI